MKRQEYFVRELTSYIEEVVERKVNSLFAQLVERLEKHTVTETEKAPEPEKRVRWTKEEDDLLIFTVNSYLKINGGKIKDALEFVHTFLPQRSLRAITLRYYYLKQQGKA